MSEEQLIRKKFMCPKARISYPYLFSPRPPNPKKPDEEPRFGVALIFEEGTDLKPMMLVAMEVAQARWPKAPAMIKSGRLHWPFRSDPEDVAEKGYPLGSTFTNTSAKSKPGVVDASLADVTDPGDAYAGRYCFASVTAYTYDVKGNKGVTFGINNLQILEHGERLDGRMSPQDEFEVEESALADLSGLDEEAVTPPDDEGTAPSAESALADLVK